MRSIQIISARAAFVLLGALLTLPGCTFHKPELGSRDNPVKIYFVPAVDSKIIYENSKVLVDWLEKTTPYRYEVAVPSSYVAVIEAFGSKRADIASMNTYGYVVAHEKYGAEGRLQIVKNGSTTYRTQIIARTDGPIKSLADLQGKKMAYVDPASTSGYLVPKKMLIDRGIKPAQEVFAMKHDGVISMVYQGQVDAGATFYTPPEEGKIQDARRLVLTQYPDVEKKIKIIELSEPIPNDPIVFRKELPEEMKAKIADAFMKFVQSPEGQATFNKLYGVTELRPTNDKAYDWVRGMMKELGHAADEAIKK
jgi:phosphonate transport system substrate-binding protein